MDLEVYSIHVICPNEKANIRKINVVLAQIFISVTYI
jgi:hypothetical protein